MALHTQGGYGPAERTRARPEPYTLGTFKDTALAAASRLLHSVESWMARAVQPAPNDERSFRPWNRPEGDFGGFGDVPARVEPAGEVAPEPLQPTPLQVEGGPLRLGGEPRTPLFRHPLDAPGPALTARRLEKETSVVQGSLLAPLDEVLAKYVQDRTGGGEGAHVFNLTARERLDFEAKLGRDLARLANTSSSRRIFDTAVTAPKPSLDVWSSAPPRGFSLGGVVAPPALPPVEKTRKANAASRKLITAESDDVVEVEKPPKKAPSVAEESDDVVEVVETRPKGRAAKSAPKPKKEAAMEKFGQGVVEQLKDFQKPEAAVEVPEDKEVQKVTSKEDFWRVQIEAIYRRRNPHKLADVSDMLEKHKGKEMVLYKKVCQRYDLNPKKLYADPQAWDSEDKDVKDEDSDGGDKASTAPTGGGLFDSAPAVPSLFLSGSSGSLFGAASSGGDSTSPFSIPVADPDKKINIFGSSTQAEKRFTSALGSTGSGGEGLFAASSGGLFGSGGIFGASSGATEETTPKTKAKPDFPPAPVFGADVEEKTPKSKVKPDFPPAPAFGLEPEKTPTKAKPAFPSGDVPTGLFAGEKTPRSKAKPAFPPAPAFGVSEEAAVSSLFGSTGTSGNIFGPLGGDTFGRQVSAPLDLVPGAEEPRSKRRAGSLPDEQKEEAAAEPGPRSKAHADVLAKRKIVRARRSKKEEAPSATEIQAKPSAEFPPPPPNQPLFTPDPAIASLAPGLPGASSSAGDEPAPSSNPFAGITGKPEPKKPEAKPAAKKAKQEETGEAEGPVKVDTKEDLWRVQIEAIYRKRNPMKLKEVPQLMEKHKGKEVILFKKVCKRYDLDPTKIYTNDDAWAGEDKEFKDDPEEPEAEAAQTGAVSVPSLFGNTGGASLFGSATSSGSLFGSGSGGSIFGNASSATSLFGSSSSAASSGGGSALFGAPTAPASGSLFGSGSGSGGSIFGASSGSIFGAPSSGNLFGSTASQSPEGGNIFAGGGGNLFGSGGNLFGSPSSGGFGAGFGAAAPSSGAGGSIFCGGSSGSSPFGGSESASLFGSGSSSGNMFAFGATGGSGGTNKKKRRAD